MPVRELPWSDRFDAAILYDTMHHFDDEAGDASRLILRTLVPGGPDLHREGARPAPGSEGEPPADRGDGADGDASCCPSIPRTSSRSWQGRASPTSRRFVEIDELVEVGDVGGMFNRMREQFSFRMGRRAPETNIPDRDEAARRWGWSGVLSGDHRRRFVAAERGWTPTRARREDPEHGRRLLADGALRTRCGHDRAVDCAAPRSMDRVASSRASRSRVPCHPAKSSLFELAVPRHAAGDANEIAVDCVREGIAWFVDLGFSSLIAPVVR